MISVHRPPARVDTRGYKITADKIVMGDTMKIEEGLNITVNPINSFGQRIENPREMVKLVDKGEQRLQILTKAPRTLYEKETQKIPGEDTNNMNSGGSAIKYKGLKSGGFYNMDNEVKKHLEEHERLKKIYDGGGLTLTEAKLRKPVDIDKMTLMRDQPAININDTEYTMLDELTFKQQEDVLGTSRYFKEPDPVISLIDVPEGGYNFRDMLPPRMRKMNKQDLLQELERYGKTGGKSIALPPPPKMEKTGGKSYNGIELQRETNANNLYQENLFNASFKGNSNRDSKRVERERIKKAGGIFRTRVLGLN